MRADPHGAVELGQAIGRESDVERLWARLREGNVLLSARSGVGKTTLARLALADAPSGWSGRLVDLGGARTSAEAFLAVVAATNVGDDAASAEPGNDDAAAAMRQAVEAELDRLPGGFALVLDDLDRWLGATKADAPAFTSALAGLLAAQPKLRVLLISNTHLPRTLARVQAGPLLPIVDRCARIELDALSPESGARLVMALLLGESITAPDRAAFGRALADNCDHVPRWIHCAVAHFAVRGKPILDGDLERCMVDALADLDAPPWGLRRELAPPLDDYEHPQRGLALSVLDQLALAEDHALSFPQLRRALAMEATIDDDAIHRVLAELRGDQLVRESGGRLHFRGELLRGAWLKLRYLA